jgi:hypothetical protein
MIPEAVFFEKMKGLYGAMDLVPKAQTLKSFHSEFLRSRLPEIDLADAIRTLAYGDHFPKLFEFIGACWRAKRNRELDKFRDETPLIKGCSLCRNGLVHYKTSSQFAEPHDCVGWCVYCDTEHPEKSRVDSKKVELLFPHKTPVFPDDYYTREQSKQIFKGLMHDMYGDYKPSPKTEWERKLSLETDSRRETEGLDVKNAKYPQKAVPLPF